MKSFTGNSSPVRGWALLLALLLGAGMMISACGEEEVPAPTTPAPTPAPPPAPTPAPTPEPAKPAAPANLRATTNGNSITWSWDAVEGAIGYNYQFGPSSTAFTDTTPTVQSLTATSYTATGLAGNTAYDFRVRAVAGTLQEQTIGDWSDAVSGTTGVAPTPTPTPTTTPISVPGNVRTSARQNTSITVAWDGVSEAEVYEVQQQASGAGSWSSASCGGAGNEVAVTECVASGLDRGTAYGFRVRAVPDAADTDSAPSAWSSAVSATTTGRPAITIEDGGLNLQWKSELDIRATPASHAITWIWDSVEDRALQPLVDHYVSLLGPGNECPSLDRNLPNPVETIDDLTANYGLWSNLDSDISVTVRGVGGDDGSDDAGAAGEVRGLCVVRTWEDDRGIRQFGEVSLAWGSTLPKSADDAPATPNPLERQNAVTRATTSIGWNYETDAGFTYTLRMLSPSRDNASPTDVAECAGGDSVASPREINSNDFAVAHRESTVMPFRHYRLCIRAENERGASEWGFVGGAAQTRPAAPSVPGFIAGESEVGTETYGGHTVNRLVWSAAERSGTPTNGALHDAVVFYTAQRSIPASSVQDVCDAPAGGNRAALNGGPTPTLINTNSGFEIEVSAAPLLGGPSGTVVPAAIAPEPNAYYVYVCIRADPVDPDPNGTVDDASGLEGPWSISSPLAYAAGVPADVTGLAADATFTTVGRVKWDWTAANSAGGLVPDGFEIRIDSGTIRTVSRTTPTYTHSAPTGTNVTLEVRQYRTVAGRRLVGGWQSVTTATN